MAQCASCEGDFILDKCVLSTIGTYLQSNPIQCTECNLRKAHNCLYVWNTGTVIAQHVSSHMNDPELFGEYYSIFVAQGHTHILKRPLLNIVHQFIKDPECIAQLIPLVLEQQQQLNPVGLRVLCARQYIIDFQGFKISANEYIIREFCLVACDATLILHCLLKLPCERSDLAVGYQRQVDWLTNNLHGLEWNITNGFSVLHVRHLVAQCCERGSIFYCKGNEKMSVLRKILQLANVTNLEDQACPALRTLQFKVDTTNCTYHQPVQVLSLIHI